MAMTVVKTEDEYYAAGFTCSPILLDEDSFTRKMDNPGGPLPLTPSSQVNE